MEGGGVIVNGTVVWKTLLVYMLAADGKHDWYDVAVLGYEPQKRQFIVQKTVAGQQLIDKGRNFICDIPFGYY